MNSIHHGEVVIDTSKVPEFRKVELGKAALNLVGLVFSQPGAEERYQEWLRERKSKVRQ